MANTFDVTDETFEAEVLKATTPVLVDFWAEWCGPCKAIAPLIDNIATQYDGKLKVAKVNVDNGGDTAAQYGVRGIPTLILFKDGELLATMIGATTKEKIEEFLQQNID